MRNFLYRLTIPFFLIVSCNTEGIVNPPIDQPHDKIYTIPVVVHVVHLGEEIGSGHNLSEERIKSQIRVLNEDFRRKEGTRGYNNHPDGGDARIEFVLAKKTPEGEDTNGIVRINAAEAEEQIQFQNFGYYASLSYWNPKHYLNIWTQPMPEDLTDIILGSATGPITDLSGADRLSPGEPVQPEGILINSAHFGVSDLDSDYNLGRTATHEAGHYLGLLHLWGTGECETNDYCEDTPPVDKAFRSVACNGQPVMKENYMNFSADSIMNIFTNDQIKRMHHVLENSPYRKTLMDSPGL